MAMSDKSTFSGLVMSAGLMMAGRLEMVFGRQLIVFRRPLVIFNGFMIFMCRRIDLV